MSRNFISNDENLFESMNCQCCMYLTLASMFFSLFSCFFTVSCVSKVVPGTNKEKVVFSQIHSQAGMYNATEIQPHINNQASMTFPWFLPCCFICPGSVYQINSIPYKPFTLLHVQTMSTQNLIHFILLSPIRSSSSPCPLHF